MRDIDALRAICEVLDQLKEEIEGTSSDLSSPDEGLRARTPTDSAFPSDWEIVDRKKGNAFSSDWSDALISSASLRLKSADFPTLRPPPSSQTRATDLQPPKKPKKRLTVRVIRPATPQGSDAGGTSENTKPAPPPGGNNAGGTSENTKPTPPQENNAGGTSEDTRPTTPGGAEATTPQATQPTTVHAPKRRKRRRPWWRRERDLKRKNHQDTTSETVQDTSTIPLRTTKPKDLHETEAKTRQGVEATTRQDNHSKTVQDTKVISPRATESKNLQDTKVISSHATESKNLQDPKLKTVHGIKATVPQDTKSKTVQDAELASSHSTKPRNLQVPKYKSGQGAEAVTAQHTKSKAVQDTKLTSSQATKYRDPQDTKPRNLQDPKPQTVQCVEATVPQGTESKTVQDTKTISPQATKSKNLQDTKPKNLQDLKPKNPQEKMLKPVQGAEDTVSRDNQPKAAQDFKTTTSQDNPFKGSYAGELSGWQSTKSKDSQGIKATPSQVTKPPSPFNPTSESSLLISGTHGQTGDFEEENFEAEDSGSDENGGIPSKWLAYQDFDFDLKHALLMEMFPDLLDVVIEKTLKECNEDFSKAADQLLSLVFIGQEEVVSTADDTAVTNANNVVGPKGIDGFAAELNPKGHPKPQSRRTERKTLFRRGIKPETCGLVPRATDSPGSLHVSTNDFIPRGPYRRDEGPPRENKWHAATKNIDFITARLPMKRSVISSIYHNGNPSIAATVRAVLEKESERLMKENAWEGSTGIPMAVNEEDVMLQARAMELTEKFPSLAPRLAYTLLRITLPLMAGVEDLAREMAKAHAEAVARSSRLDIIVLPPPKIEISPPSPSRTKRSPPSAGAVVLSTNAKKLAIQHRRIAHDLGLQASAASRKGPPGPQRGGEVIHYTDRARQHAEQAKRYENMRVNAMVEDQSTPDKLDLHGVSVRDAICITRQKVKSWWANQGEAIFDHRIRPQPAYLIVTGVGRHSKDGQAKLGPAVGKMLVREGWKVQFSGGSLTVTGIVKG